MKNLRKTLGLSIITAAMLLGLFVTSCSEDNQSEIEVQETTEDSLENLESDPLAIQYFNAVESYQQIFIDGLKAAGMTSAEFYEAQENNDFELIYDVFGDDLVEPGKELESLSGLLQEKYPSLQEGDRVDVDPSSIDLLDESLGERGCGWAEKVSCYIVCSTDATLCGVALAELGAAGEAACYSYYNACVLSCELICADL